MTPDMAERDYYEILGVSRSATPDQIRAAYRKLARELHPDVNKAPDAAERFAEVQDAYDTLSDADKRAAYDRYGRAGAAGAAGAARAGGGGGGGAHYTWQSVGAPGGGAGADFDLDDLGSMFDAFFGGAGAGGGAGGRAGRARAGRRRAPARPEPQHAEIEVSFQTMASGGTQTVRRRHGSRTTTIDVTIPKAVADGAKLRVPGRTPEEPDLVLTVRVGRHPLYRREGRLDLALTLPLTLAEAALGCEVRVPTVEGPVTLTVPPGTRSGRRLRLRERGLADARGARGDLFAEVQIVPPPPEALEEADREALRALSARGPSPRGGGAWAQAAGG